MRMRRFMMQSVCMQGTTEEKCVAELIFNFAIMAFMSSRGLLTTSFSLSLPCYSFVKSDLDDNEN